jgi:aspartate aminotransferase
MTSFNIHEFYDRLNTLKVEYRLDAGQPDIPVDERILEVLNDSLHSGETRYVSAGGIKELREVIASTYGVEPGEVVIGPGSKLLVASQIHRSKSIGVIRPYWPSYYGISSQLGKKIILIKAEFRDKWVPRLNNAEHIDTLIINYPNNPTGIVLDHDRLKSIVDHASEENIRIVSDEVYGDITYNNKFRSILEFNYDNAVFIHSFSKTFSMTGFRIGFAIANRDTIKGIEKYLENTVTCIPMFIQRAAIKAMEIRDEVIKKVRNIYRERLRTFKKTIDNKLFRYIEPDGAIYIFLHLGHLGITGVEMAYKLSERGVGVFPGEAFGMDEPFIRVALTDPRMAEAVEIINSLGEKLWST